MEIKTCEQFVIMELEEARKKIEELEEEIAKRGRLIGSISNRNDALKSLIKYDGNSHHFELSIWKDFEPEKYEALCDMLGIFEEEKEDE